MSTFPGSKFPLVDLRCLSDLSLRYGEDEKKISCENLLFPFNPRGVGCSKGWAAAGVITGVIPVRDLLTAGTVVGAELHKEGVCRAELSLCFHGSTAINPFCP